MLDLNKTASYYDKVRLSEAFDNHHRLKGTSMMGREQASNQAVKNIVCLPVGPAPGLLRRSRIRDLGNR